MQNIFSLNVLVLGIQIIFVFGENIKLDYFSSIFTESNDQKTSSNSKILLDYVMNSNKMRSNESCCSLEIHKIDLKEKDNMTLYKNLQYSPSCIEVVQCKGSCNNKNHSCLSNGFMKTQNVRIKVFDNESGKTEEKNFSVTHHTECRCGCDIKSCLIPQNYDEEQCTCCSDLEKKKCEKKHDFFKWDPVNCTCVCTRPPDWCSTGLKPNLNTCKCDSVPE